MVKLFALSIVLSSFLVAQTNNQIDNGYIKKDVEKGKHFYDDSQSEDVEKNVGITEKDSKDNKSNSTNKILLEIVKELKSQRKELEEIKKTLNPNEPRMIVNSKGEKCLSNSTPDCMDIPVIQEGRNMPALYNFIKEPNEENAKNWLQVQAKLFNHYSQMGFALKFAALNGDENTYPVNALNIYGTPKENITSDLYKDKILKILDDKKNELGTMVFLGKSKKIEDHWGKNAIGLLGFKKGTYYNIALVFDSIETKRDYDEYYKKINDQDLKKVYETYPKVISEPLFKKYAINVTPSAVAVYKSKDKEISSVIERGYLTQSSLIHSYENFLVYNKIVDPKEFHSAQIWNVELEK